jgi:LysR family glycine cleavage system transcriptional activator
MTRVLPPLNALRAFEVAARHLSFTKAANELCVTPAAVGHQIKVLEDHLGVALFRRLNRGLLLTEAGQACLPALQEGFERLIFAAEQVHRHAARGILRASIAPTLAVKWLVPRLPQFQALHPDLNVRLETSMDLVDLAREGFDLALRYCPGPGAGLRGERLFGEEIVVVCSPHILVGQRILRRPDDLRLHTLIHVAGETSDPTRVDWAGWLRAAGAKEVDPGSGLHFTQTLVAVQAALDGQGVALLGRTCVLDDLAAGRLVQPFDLGFPTDYAYYLVSPDGSPESPSLGAFRSWVQEEARQSLRQAETARP